MPQTHWPLPQPDAAYVADLQAFLLGEDAARFVDQFQPFVSSGGLHGPGAGLTGTPTPLTAYANGQWVTETGGIAYPNGANVWVIADELTAGNRLTFVRVAGTHYLIDSTSVAEPPTPTGAVPLMRVTTAGGAITAVRDMRPMSPVRTVANRGMVFSSHYATLQEAVNALPPAGGTVFIEPGTYVLTSTLQLGNGAVSTVSTRQGIYLVGMGAPYSAEFGYTDEPAVKLVWAGGAAPVIKVAGPLAGWGVSNLSIDGTSAATYGLLVVSAQYGDVHNICVRRCTVAGLGSTTVTTFGGAANTSSFHNEWSNIFVDAPGSFGIELTSSNPQANTGFNTFSNIFVVISGNGIGLQLGACSNNVFLNMHFTCGAGAGAPVNFAYDNGQSSLWPAANAFYGIEPHNKAMTQTGAAGALLSSNLMAGISQANGALVPEVEGLYAYFTDADGNFNLLAAYITANIKQNGDVTIVSTPLHIHSLVPTDQKVADVGAQTFMWRLVWSGGGVATSVRNVTAANDTPQVEDHTMLADCGAGSVTFNLLPVASVPGKVYIFKKTDASGNAMIINPNASETIDGSSASLSLTTQWQTRTIQSTGLTWVRLDRA